MDIVNEGDVVAGVPVEAVAVQGEGHGVEHPVDRRHHVLTILICRAVGDGQTAGYKVVLHIHNYQGAPGLHNLQGTSL